jgi:NTE family protein
MERDLARDLPRPLAFVFSGGANLGAVQVGMLKALCEAGIYPDLAVGASVGALNAALIANHGLEKGTAILENIWRTIRRGDLFPGGALAQAWRLLRSRTHLHPNNGLAALICRWLTVTTLEELRMPLGVLATDLVRQRGMLFNCGPLHQALLASTAIPGVYPPVEIGGVTYIDGGFTSNVPLLAALRMGARSVVVLDVGGSCAPHEQPHNIADMVVTAIRASLRNRVLLEIPAVTTAAPVLYLPSPCLEKNPLLDFTSSVQLMAEAEDICSVFLATCATPQIGHMVGEPHFHGEDRVCEQAAA